MLIWMKLPMMMKLPRRPFDLLVFVWTCNLQLLLMSWLQVNVSIDMPYKSCLVALLLLIFTSLVDIVDTLSGIDWLILLTLVASMIIIITTASSKQSVLSTVDALTDLTTTTASVSSALSDIDDANLASRRYCSQSETTLTLSNWKLPPTVPFNLMGTLRACLSSVLQHVRQERHSLLVAFLLMASAPIAVIIAVLMVLDFWMTDSSFGCCNLPHLCHNIHHEGIAIYTNSFEGINYCLG